jgi:hypothetical protein
VGWEELPLRFSGGSDSVGPDDGALRAGDFD